MNFIVINGYKYDLINNQLEYTIIQLCDELNINIPRFCYHDKLSIAGNCRMCMVEVENGIKPIIACSTSLSKGLSIYTNSGLVKKARENVIEFLLINHPLDCPICDQGGECDLQDQTVIYGGDRGRFKEEKRSVSDKNFNPFIKTIMTRCIHCTRCVRFSDEIMGLENLGTMGRGNATEIGTYLDTYMIHELSGNLVDVCPVGALTSKPYAFTGRPWELTSIESIDIFDGLCSNIRVDIKNNIIMRILPKLNERINDEWITDKARYSYDGVQNERITISLYNLKDKLIYCSNNFAFNLFSSKVLSSSTLFYLGDLLELNSLLLLDFITTRLLGKFYFFHNEVCASRIDFRSSYLLDDQLMTLENIILLGVNLKKECSLLYTKLKLANVRFLYWGLSNFKSNNVLHMGLSFESFSSYVAGKMLYPIVAKGIITNNLNLSFVHYNFLPSYSLQLHSSNLNYAEAGLGSTFSNDWSNTSIDVVCLLNYYKPISKAYMDCFVVHIGHHGNTNAVDLYIPLATCFESVGYHINIFGYLQKHEQVIYKNKNILDLVTILNSMFDLSLNENIYEVKRLTRIFSLECINSVIYNSPILRTSVPNFYKTNIISSYSLNMLKVSKLLRNLNFHNFSC